MLLLSAFSSPFRKNFFCGIIGCKKNRSKKLCFDTLVEMRGWRKEHSDAIAIAVCGKSVSP